MNFDEHYGELTSEIKLDGNTPEANSMPIHALNSIYNIF